MILICILLFFLWNIYVLFFSLIRCLIDFFCMLFIICLIFLDIGDRKVFKNLLLIFFVFYGINKKYNNFWYDYIEFIYDKICVLFLGVIIINDFRFIYNE